MDKKHTSYVTLDKTGLENMIKSLLGAPVSLHYRTVTNAVIITLTESMEKQEIQQTIYDWLKIRVERP